MVIDTLTLLKKIWGKRCGNIKMESLGKYFGLGIEKHRAIEDCEMTLEVMKKVALTIILENEFGKIDQKISTIVLPPKPQVEKKKIENQIDPVEQEKKKKVISQAIKENKNLMMIYSGGKTPGVRRIIVPIRFSEKNDDQLFAKTFNAKNEYTYTISKILDYEITEEKEINN